MQGGSRTEPEASRLAARAFLAHAAKLLVSYKPLALTLPISACVASSRMEAIDRQLPEAKRALDIDATIELEHRGGALPPTTGPRASLTYCSKYSISC